MNGGLRIGFWFSVVPLALFSVNGTGDAKDTTVTFLAAGTYTFSVTASDIQLGSQSHIDVSDP